MKIINLANIDTSNCRMQVEELYQGNVQQKYDIEGKLEYLLAEMKKKRLSNAVFTGTNAEIFLFSGEKVCLKELSNGELLLLNGLSVEQLRDVSKF